MQKSILHFDYIDSAIDPVSWHVSNNLQPIFRYKVTLCVDYLYGNSI